MDSRVHPLELDIDQDKDSFEQVRLIQQLRVRIGDVKNLKNINGCFKRSYYCVVELDQEEIYRSQSSVEKFSQLTFGEDFHFDIPKLFRYLNVYLYQSQRTLCNSVLSRALGKVVIPYNELRDPILREDQWLPLLPMNAVADVQGKVNLSADCQWDSSINELVFTINIAKCQDIWTYPCDSFACIKLKDDRGVNTFKTKIVKKTTNPEFHETFRLNLKNSCDSPEKMVRRLQLTINLYRETLTKQLDLGEVNVPLIDLENGKHFWYYLHRKDILEPNIDTLNAVGMMRLRLNYVSNYVLPGNFYHNLLNLLLSSIDVKPMSANLVYILGEFTLNKADVAQPLVKIFLSHKKVLPLINLLAEDEISKVTDVNTIFRGNSLVSKCIDELMKLVGFNYLQGTIKNIIEQIINDGKPCEIDQAKLSAGEDLETNRTNLREYISLIFEAITSSFERCPRVMIEVFNLLKDLANKYFFDRQEVSFYVISGFVFLRFFAPSILNPRLFGLTDMQIIPSTNRTFTLISKTIQSIGNLIILRRNNPVNKEDYMLPLFQHFLTEDYIGQTKEFLSSISSLDQSGPRELVQMEYTILRDSMYKKSACPRATSVFGSNYKKRFFRLTNHNLSYSKSKNKPAHNKFPLNELTSVPIKPEDDYSYSNAFTVSHRKKNFIIKATNCVQAKEWMDTINRLVQHNSSLANNKSQANGSTAGVIMPLEIDTEKEMEQIFSILVTNQGNIDLLSRACEEKLPMVKLWKDGSNTHSSQFIIEDVGRLLTTLNELKACMLALQRVHARCMLSIRGSHIAPIDVAN